MINIERELFALLPKGVKEIMPNHCHNRVTFYSANTEDVAKLKQIFEDENCFTQIIPEPDWANTPLMSSDVKGLVYDRGKVGELPMQPSNENGHYVIDLLSYLIYSSFSIIS